MLRFRDFDTNLERPILCWVQTLDDSGVEVTCEVEPLRFRDFDTTLVGRLLFCCVETLDDNDVNVEFVGTRLVISTNAVGGVGKSSKLSNNLTSILLHIFMVYAPLTWYRIRFSGQQHLPFRIITLL